MRGRLKICLKEGQAARTDEKLSGRKIIEILKKNPEKDPENYDDGVF